jgi:hypothetical protein
MLERRYLLSGCMSALLFVMSASANIIQTGAFSTDDEQGEFDFTLRDASLVTIRTWSFGGGTNAAGQAILSGGFAPVLTLFVDSIGFLPPVVDSGGTAPSACGLRAIDPATNLCLDAYLTAILSPGAYVLILTQYDNFPLGNTPLDGFSESGNGNFTGGPFLLNAGPGYQRTGNWAVDVIATPLTSTPEPEASIGVMLLSTAWLLVRARIWRRRGGDANDNQKLHFIGRCRGASGGAIGS